MGMFSGEVDLRSAERTINRLIKEVQNSGGSVYLVDKNNPDFSMKLDREIEICYFFLASNDPNCSNCNKVSNYTTDYPSYRGMPEYDD